MEIPSILDTAKFRHLLLDEVNSVTTEINNLQGFQIPQYDEIDVSYYESTNNIHNVLYKSAGNVVATLTLTYSVQPPTANDANLIKVALS